MERRMGPIAHALHQRMLDRIEMNVIDVPRKISFVADGVLPEPPLPKRQTTVRRRFNSAEASINALLK